MDPDLGWFSVQSQARMAIAINRLFYPEAGGEAGSIYGFVC